MFKNGLIWTEQLAGALNTSPLALLIIVCAIYAIALALPFVPGMEIGLFIMAAFGKPGVLGAWLATVIGLNLAFFIGHHFQNHPWVQLSRERLNNTNDAEKSTMGRVRIWIVTQVIHYPYLLIAFVYNVPGNIILGGGGGISLAAGAAKGLTWPKFFATTVIATAGIPILAWFGINYIG
jgi:hypothetical protein